MKLMQSAPENNSEDSFTAKSLCDLEPTLNSSIWNKLLLQWKLRAKTSHQHCKEEIFVMKHTPKENWIDG